MPVTQSSHHKRYKNRSCSRKRGAGNRLFLFKKSLTSGQITAINTQRPASITWAVGYDGRNRVTSFARNNAQTSYTYDPNSNRISSIAKTTADTDLDGDFDADDKSKAVAQALAIDPQSNKLLGFSQSTVTTRGTRTLSTVNTNVAYSLDAAGNLTSDGLRVRAD